MVQLPVLQLQAMTPQLLKAIREGDEAALDEYSAPERAAMMALAEDFGR